MNDKKDSQTDSTTIKRVAKYPSTAMDGPVESQIKSAVSKKPEKLVLDEGSVRPARTRNELYKELTKNDKVKEEEDYFEFANPVFRGIALAIDAVFAFVLVKFAMLSAPFEAKIIHLMFLDKYKLQFMFGEEAFVKVIMAVSVFLAVFLFIVIPVAFFNVSLGKKLTKLRVRGDNKYTLSISQAFQRELIYKPIGIACLVGFILPFFDKKKKSLHDKMAGTFVVKE